MQVTEETNKVLTKSASVMQTYSNAQKKFSEKVENMKFEHLGNEHFVKMFGNMYDLDKRYQRRKEIEKKA